MKPGGVVGALIGGVLSAVLWGLIVAATKFEIGYMATGVGFVVGFASARLGGRGTVNGVLCAIVAVLSMFGGKMLSGRLLLPSQIREMASAEGEGPKMTGAELEATIDLMVNSLTMQDYITFTAESLDVIDILFAVFGVGAAFQIGAGRRDIAMQTRGIEPGHAPAPPPDPSQPPATPSEPIAPPPPPGGSEPQDPPEPPPRPV